MAGPARARPPAPRPDSPWRPALVAVLGLLACGGSIALAPAACAAAAIPAASAPRQEVRKSPCDRDKPAQKQMLVQASEINYDYANKRVAAVGNVQIYYGGSTLEADKVIYDQNTKRLHAEGNVRLTERGRQDHLRRDHGSVGRLPRRLRRLAAPRRARPDPHGCRARRALERQLHRLPQRRLHRLRALQGRSEEAAAVAGEGRAHHPRPGREDDLLRGRAASNSSASRWPGCRISRRPIRPSSARPAS